MKTTEPCWILGFDAEDVSQWRDANLAFAIDAAWQSAANPGALQAWWRACSDGYAFRWYINEALAQELDGRIAWRLFLIGNSQLIPNDASTYLPPHEVGASAQLHSQPAVRSAS